MRHDQLRSDIGSKVSETGRLDPGVCKYLAEE
jgi:hypothetical protein